MSDPLQDELRAIVRTHGDEILEDSTRLSQLLTHGSDPARLGPVLAAIDAEAPMLLHMTPPGTDLDGRLDQLARRMVRLGLTDDDGADYAVRTWAYALELVDDPAAALVGAGRGARPSAGTDTAGYDVDVVDWPAASATSAASAGLTGSPTSPTLTEGRSAVQIRAVLIGACVAVLAIFVVGFVMLSSSGATQRATAPTAQGGTAGSASGSAFPDTGSAGPCPVADKPTPKNDSYVRPAGITIDPARKWTATFDTSCGNMVFTLDGGSAVDLNNFAYLAKGGFYDNTVFHKMVPGAILAGGDPSGTDPSKAGTGNPGYVYPGAPPPTGADRYPIGSLLLDNESTTATNGSRFLIVIGPDGTKVPARYTVLGHLTGGRDVMENLGKMPTTSDGEGVPVLPLVVRHIEVAPA